MTRLLRIEVQLDVPDEDAEDVAAEVTGSLLAYAAVVSVDGELDDAMPLSGAEGEG